MVRIANFNENLEQNIVKLNPEIKVQMESVESKDLSQKEIVKRSIKATADQIIPEPKTQSQIQDTSSDNDKSDLLPDYLDKNTDLNIKEEVNNLIETFFNEGFESAIKKSKKVDAFIEDAFHDALAEKLIPELNKRGLLNKK